MTRNAHINQIYQNKWSSDDIAPKYVTDTYLSNRDIRNITHSNNCKAPKIKNNLIFQQHDSSHEWKKVQYVHGRLNKTTHINTTPTIHQTNNTEQNKNNTQMVQDT